MRICYNKSVFLEEQQGGTCLLYTSVVKFIERSIEIMRKTNFNLDVGHSMSYRQENIVERVFVPLSEPLRNEFAHFAQCIREGVQPQTDGRMSLKALQLCEMISEGAF